MILPFIGNFRDFISISSFTIEEEGRFDAFGRGFRAPKRGHVFWSSSARFYWQKWFKRRAHLSGLMRLSALSVSPFFSL